MWCMVYTYASIVTVIHCHNANYDPVMCALVGQASET